MPRPRPISCLILLCLVILAGPALANTAVVRGGEHDGFTRLTVVTETPTAYLSHRKIGDATFEIDVSTPITLLDTTRAFDRLNAGRVRMVRWSGAKLDIELTCKCEIRISNYSDNFLIVDVLEGPEPGGKPDGSERRDPDGTPGENPGTVMPEGAGSVLLPSVLELDPSLIERVSGQISSQLMMGRPSVIVPQMPEMDPVMLDHAPERPEGREFRFDGPDCRMFHDIWELIDSGPEPGIAHDDTAADAAMARVLDVMQAGRADRHLAYLITTGLLTEAQGFLPASSTESMELNRYRHLAAGLRGEPVAGPIRIDPACGPFAEMARFVMQGTRLSDMTNDHILNLYHAFEQLPLGLKLALFPAFEAVLTRVSPKGHDALYAHRAREVALLASMGLAPDDENHATDGPHDPDLVAAVARELRGTQAERASLIATFEAYLAGHRYLDAASVLDDLREEDKRELWSRLLRSLAETADPITFLSVTLTAIEDGAGGVSVKVAERVMARLLDEGFPETALGLFQLRAEYAQDEGLGRLAARAQLAMGEPASALQILEPLRGADSEQLKAEAFAALDDPVRALGAVPEDDPSGARTRLQWMAGQYTDLAETGAGTPQAEFARLVSDQSGADSGPITVLSARERIETSTLIRQRLADLLRKDPLR